MVGRFGCLSDPKGYVLDRFLGERQDTLPFMWGGWGGDAGEGRLDNSLTLLPCMLTGKTTKTNLQNKPK